MSSRPQVAVYGESSSTTNTLPLPAVFRAPIRPDLIRSVHTAVAKNKRQPYAVSAKAGHQTSAESWGTGRAVARVPRVSGGGTHRAGQAAFANFCRGGRMFAPTKTWRKWHVKTNLNQKRYAIASAIAASSVPSLVLARGHRIEEIAEIPLVIEADYLTTASKTKAAVGLLKSIKAHRDVAKVSNSRKLRAGKGKMRGRRYRQRRGPLIVHAGEESIYKAFRNLPGVEIADVNSLNLLQLAPGGHLGRFIIWSSSAFKQLDKLFGSSNSASELKKDYVLPFNMMTNPDITRIISSDEIQSVLRPKGEERQKRTGGLKKNPLKNRNIMYRMNPYARAFKPEGKIEDKANSKASQKFLSTLRSD